MKQFVTLGLRVVNDVRTEIITFPRAFIERLSFDAVADLRLAQSDVQMHPIIVYFKQFYSDTPQKIAERTMRR